MKMRAGLKLWGRKPTHMPRVMTASSGPMLGGSRRPASLSCWLYRKNVPDAMATMPAARPSSPSMRLTALAIRSSQITVTSGTQSAPIEYTSENGTRK